MGPCCLSRPATRGMTKASGTPIAMVTASRTPAVPAETPASRKICGIQPMVMYAAVAWSPKKQASAPGGPAAGDPERRGVGGTGDPTGRGPVRRGRSGRRGPVPYEDDPGQHREGREHGPDGRARTASSRPSRSVSGHGDGGGEGGAEGQGHGVEAGHGADAVGEPALDDHRHQDVADGDAHQGQGAGGQEPGGGADVRADHQARRDGGHARADDGTRTEAAGQAGRHDPEDREAERRHGGEHARHAAAHVQPVADLFEEGAEAGDGGAEVEGGQDEPDGDQAQQPGGGGLGGSGEPRGREAGGGVRGAAAVQGRGLGLVVRHEAIIESWDDWLSNRRGDDRIPRSPGTSLRESGPDLTAHEQGAPWR